MNPALILLAAVIGYVLGSLPFGYWIARAHGVNILAAGSGNPGATNVKRSVGKRAGNLVFVLDFFKGLVAAGLWLLLLEGEVAVEAGVAGLAGAILGHSFSFLLRFRGGKGVATTLGGTLALIPWAALVGLVIWLAVYFAFRFVSLASLVLAASLPVSTWLIYGPGLLFWFALGLAVLIFIRHRDNLTRLRRGTEHRFNPPSSSPSSRDPQSPSS
ncbi:MAG: glycerol-3-phosphate 1-O-acyltransferase [Puniceicoccaceae bacterium]|nr:MAG: glycerol-3-phosphate 1-O-acyltransferase [Puniceicoccaceae bacterium]